MMSTGSSLEYAVSLIGFIGFIRNVMPQKWLLICDFSSTKIKPSGMTFCSCVTIFSKTINI